MMLFYKITINTIVKKNRLSNNHNYILLADSANVVLQNKKKNTYEYSHTFHENRSNRFGGAR